MDGFDNYGEHDLHDLRDLRDRQLDAEAAWHDYLDDQREQHIDRLRRDDPVLSRCDLCGGRGAKSIYGMRCRSCHEARRLEREAA